MFTFSGMRHRSLSVIGFLLILMGIGCSNFLGSNNIDKVSEKIQTEIISNDVMMSHHDAKQLLDYSPSGTKKWFESAADYRNVLQGLDTSKMKEKSQLKYEMLDTYLQIVLQRDSFLFHHYLISHAYGLHLAAPAYFEQLKIDSERDIENYLLELSEIESKFVSLIDGLENQRKLGIVPPSFVLKKVIVQCDSLADLLDKQNPFYITLATQLSSNDFTTSESEKEMLNRCKQTIIETVIPSYKRLAGYLRQLEHASVSVAGVWQLPRGEDFYAYMLQFHTGYAGDLGQLYRIGKVELRSIEGELAILQNMTSVTDSSFAFLGEDYAHSKAYLFPAFEKGMQLFERYAKLSASEAVTPVEKLEFLAAHQLATAEMMTDIGIHHKQWLREQAVRFLQKHSQLTERQAQEHVDRIIVYPGLVSASKIGYLKLQELKGSKTAYRFLNEMHNLEPVQFSVLEKWLSKNQQLPS